MEKDTKQAFHFKAISGKKVIADFNGGNVTSDAGLLFLREVESRLGIIQRIADVLPDDRHQSYVQHSINQLLTQRVFQIAAGYEDANDSDHLKDDPVLKIACNRLKDSLASQPTMSRFENGFSRTDLYRIAQAFLDNFIHSYEKAPKAILLDLDDTEDPTHGAQQLILFNGYYNNYCYLPLHIYEGKSGKLITTILRPGKRPTGSEIMMILKRIIDRIREAWPEVGILVRGDSHFAYKELMDYCEHLGLKYIFGLTTKDPMVKQSAGLVKQAEMFFLKDKQPVKLFGEFTYQASSWTILRRVIYKAEHNAKGSNLRFIVTNLENRHRSMVYNLIYCGRGAMELLIKEHKNHLRSDKTSCTRFLANQFRLFLHSIAYVLLHAFREQCLQSTQFAKAQFDTIRLKILKLGVRVVMMSTKIKIHWPTSCPYQEELYRIWQMCVT